MKPEKIEYQRRSELLTKMTAFLNREFRGVEDEYYLCRSSFTMKMSKYEQTLDSDYCGQESILFTVKHNLRLHFVNISSRQ